MKYSTVSYFTDLLEWLFGIDKGVLRTGPEADWKLGWQNLPSTWLLVLVIVPAAVVGCYLVYRWEPGEGASIRKYVLAGLRLLAVSIILLLLFQPYLYNEIELQKQNHLAVLVDTSGSMSFNDHYEREGVRNRLKNLAEINGNGSSEPLNELPRLELLKRVFNNEEVQLLERMSRDQMLDLYRFSTELQAQNPDGEIELSDRKGGTAVGGAIESVYRDQRGRKTSGIVLFTDGQSNIGSDPLTVVRNQRKQGNDLPIYTVAVGARDEPEDLVLEGVEAPDAAQTNAQDPVEFSVRVRSQDSDWTGSTQLRLLTEEGKELAGSQITGKPETREITGTMNWKPEEPGTYRLRVRVEPVDGEIRTENNEVVHRIRVLDRKLRVFYFERLPRYEYRFLKNALIRDDSLEVKCLLYSADEQYPQPTSPGLSPATHFPRTREELAQYDVILIGDVRPSMFRGLGVDARTVLDRLQVFVEELGGGVLFMAGPNYNPSSYSGTPLERLLPVIPGSGRRSVERTVSFNPKLTPIGKSHPVTQLVNNHEQNVELWEDRREDTYSLEPLRWFYPVRKEKLGAKTLARVPEQDGEENATPLITVNRYGRGRTMYVGTDDTWIWRRLIGNKYFYTFWRNSIRWLRGGRLSRSKRYELRVDKKTYTPGDKVTVYARVLDRNFRPETSETVPVHLLHSSTNTRRTLTMNRKEEAGQYRATFKPGELGGYRLWIGSYPFSAEEKEGETDYAETRFDVEPLDLEAKDPSVNRELLRKIAGISGGKFLYLDQILRETDQASSLPDLVHKKPERISLKPQKEDLWDAPIFLLLFVVVLGAEWILRKRARLI